MKDRQKSRRFLGIRTVNAGHASLGYCAANGHRMRHLLHGMISGVAGLTGDLQVSIFSADPRTYGCAHDWPSARDCAAPARARTMARFASSILNPLYLCAIAGFMAASAAAWKVFSSA